MSTASFSSKQYKHSRQIAGKLPPADCRLCPLSLMGAYYLHPPDARAIFLGGGGANGKDPKINIRNQKLKTLIFKN